MDFTLTSWRAEAAMGYGLTTREEASLYRYWWHIGYLLGIDPRLIEGISSHDQAGRIDALLQAVTGPLVPDATALTAATIESVCDELRNAIKLPTGIGKRGLEALARRCHGDEVGIDRNLATEMIIDKAVGSIRRSRVKARRDPEAWAAAIAESIAKIGAQLAGETEHAQYETHGGPASA